MQRESLILKFGDRTFDLGRGPTLRQLKDISRAIGRNDYEDTIEPDVLVITAGLSRNYPDAAADAYVIEVETVAELREAASAVLRWAGFLNPADEPAPVASAGAGAVE